MLNQSDLSTQFPCKDMILIRRDVNCSIVSRFHECYIRTSITVNQSLIRKPSTLNSLSFHYFGSTAVRLIVIQIPLISFSLMWRTRQLLHLVLVYDFVMDDLAFKFQWIQVKVEEHVCNK